MIVGTGINLPINSGNQFGESFKRLEKELQHDLALPCHLAFNQMNLHLIEEILAHPYSMMPYS